MASPPPRLRRSKSYPGRRKKRLRRAAGILVAVLVVASAAAIWIYRATRPEVRKPGEKLDDITESLSRNLPATAPEPRFTDVTAEAGLGSFSTFAGVRSSQLPEDMGSGAAWGDFDNDGDDDLFLVAAGGTLTLPDSARAPSELYENLGDGTFRRVADFPKTRVQGMAAAWGDVDGDGWLDLVVSGYGALSLFRNERGRLERDPDFPSPPGYWAGATWGDFDNDRDLDLYVCGYVEYAEDAGAARRVSDQYGAAVPYTLNPASFEPQRNLLLENDGRGRFTEVAELWGVSNPGGRSLGALWHDFDQDGRLDLYVANDISDNALFLNRGETFEDVSLAAWVADYRGAMGLAAGDWNRDGDDDLFVTHWIAQENALYDSRLVDFRQRNADAGSAVPAQLVFSDLAAPLGLGQIALHSVGWGTEFADFDADGWLDLLVVNGSTLETGDEPKRLRQQPAMLMWNQAGESFHDLAPLAPLLSEPRSARGLALSDYDGDGDLDALVVVLGEGVKLLRNEMQSGRWLELDLRGRNARGEPTTRGEGATVSVRLGELVLRRSVGGASYLSQSSRTLHFGLGAEARVDAVEVRWPGGETQELGPLEADSRWELIEGDPEPRRVATSPLGPPESRSSATTPPPATSINERQRLTRFWEAQRAGMDAFKLRGDCDAAVGHFRAALALEPGHEDSRYYLANCLATMGHIDEAAQELDRMRAGSPMSHRAHKQWGVLRAMRAESEADLAAAEAALQRALEINREETGSLLVLGEISLLRGRGEEADRRLELACRTNPRAVGGFFLRGYLAWKRGESEAAIGFLESARGALGDEWKPEGAVAEGDVASRMHREATPLSRFWEVWNGEADPAAAYSEIEAHLRELGIN